MKRAALFTTVVLGLLTLGGVAAADEPTAQPTKKGKEIWVDPVKVVGRSRPILAIDVARVTHSVALSDLRQRFLNRIEKPVEAAPF